MDLYLAVGSFVIATMFLFLALRVQRRLGGYPLGLTVARARGWQINVISQLANKHDH
ncbi:MAG TPA: hypothetical protein VK821_18425 [Dehalococcoidia bacterium]|nr:hypothetical protein [Dehalococcoidia bacterium]